MIALVAIATPAFMTTTPMNFSCGILFGIVNGTLVFLVGALLGSVIAFIISRFLAFDWATAQMQSSPTLTSLNKAMKSKGLFMIILARLSPAFPFSMLSYIFGVTQCSLFHYVIGTALGLIPGKW